MFWRYLQLMIYWGSWLVWILLIWIVSILPVQPANWLWWILLMLSGLFIYARFVEPYLLRVRRENFKLGKGKEEVRLVLISDMHLGVFHGEKFLRKIMGVVLAQKPDLVVIPGDLINDPSVAQLKEMFAPLKNFPVPIYAVTGNHDSKKPGYHESEKVREALRRAGVQTIDNAQAIFEKGFVRLHLYGLSDLMEGKADFSVLEKMRSNQHNIIVAHNPDAAYQIEDILPAKLILSGHTHAGQIQIPFIYKWLIPCKYKFIRGWYKVRGRQVYVSSGLGEVILPMRLGAIPEIVVMDLKI